jgi:hypothetical protein
MPMSKVLHLIVATGLEKLEAVNIPNAWIVGEPVRVVDPASMRSRKNTASTPCFWARVWRPSRGANTPAIGPNSRAGAVCCCPGKETGNAGGFLCWERCKERARKERGQNGVEIRHGASKSLWCAIISSLRHSWVYCLQPHVTLAASRWTFTR